MQDNPNPSTHQKFPLNNSKLKRITPKTLANMPPNQDPLAHIEENSNTINSMISNLGKNSDSSKIPQMKWSTKKLEPLQNNTQQANNNPQISQKLIRPKLNSQHNHHNHTTVTNNNNVNSAQKLQKKEFCTQNKMVKDFTSKEKREVPIVTTTDLLNNKKKLNEEFLLQKSQKQSLQEIQKLSIKQENLFVFEVDFQLENLHSLSLSYNSIVNVFGIAKLKSLKVLDLSNNFISEIFPLNQLESLQKLNLANNRIQTIKPLKNKTLQYIDLQKNSLTNFTETVSTLSEFSALQELHLKDNPCTAQRHFYKYDLLYNLKLAKLDSEILTEQDYKLSKDFNNTKNKPQFSQQQQENGQNEGDLSSSVMVRPSTAQGRVGQKHGFMQQEVVGSLRVQELEKKVQQLEKRLEEQQEELSKALQEREEVIEENEGCYADLEELQYQLEEIQQENEEMRQECYDLKGLKEQNLELKRQIASYESTMIFKDADKEELGQQIVYLNKQIEDLNYQEKMHKIKIQELQEMIDGLQQ